PLLLQILDVTCQRRRMQRGADQSFHPLDELGALRRDREALPVVDLLQLFIELSQLVCEMGWQRRSARQFFFNRSTQARGSSAAAGRERALRFAQQTADLAQGMRF